MHQCVKTTVIDRNVRTADHSLRTVKSQV